ncbi:MAG: class I SAM-dependent methyltransferase [Chitinophagales bacterium]
MFLDHRLTRQKVREIATEKKVLNLFAYKSEVFQDGVAAGNAQTITTVDMSRTYLTWAKRNLSYNKLYDEKNIHLYNTRYAVVFEKNGIQFV